MPFTGPFILHTAQGIFSADGVTPIERWVVTLKIYNNSMTPASPSLLPAFLDAVTTPWTTFHNDTAVSPGTACYLTTLTAAVVGPDGLYTGDGTQKTTTKALTPDAGPGSGGLPWSTACVYTLRTAAFQGRASRGRMYYPACGTAVASDGRWSLANVASRAAAAKTLFTAINAAADPEFAAGAALSVMSSIGGGTTRSVTAVAVGRLPDRQERREGDLNEEYVSQTI